MSTYRELDWFAHSIPAPSYSVKDCIPLLTHGIAGGTL